MFDRNKDNRQKQPDSQDMPTPNPAPTTTTSKAPAAAGSKGGLATIGATIRIKGDVSGDENLLIEGTVEGTVNLLAHELVTGESGKVNADIVAKTVRVHGDVQGDISGKENVIISSTSHVKGNIVTPRMTLEDGARFKGSIDIDPAAANNKPGPADSSSSIKPVSGAQPDKQEKDDKQTSNPGKGK